MENFFQEAGGYTSSVGIVGVRAILWYVPARFCGMFLWFVAKTSQISFFFFTCLCKLDKWMLGIPSFGVKMPLGLNIFVGWLMCHTSIVVLGYVAMSCIKYEALLKCFLPLDVFVFRYRAEFYSKTGPFVFSVSLRFKGLAILCTEVHSE